MARCAPCPQGLPKGLAAALLALSCCLSTGERVLAVEPVGDPIRACSHPDLDAAQVSFDGLGYLSGGSVFLFSCGNRLGRLDLGSRRVEVLSADTHLAGRPDGSLVLIDTPAGFPQESEFPEGGYFSAEGQRLAIVGPQALEVRLVNGELRTRSVYAEHLDGGEADASMAPSAMAIAADGRSVLIGFPRGLAQLWGVNGTLRHSFRGFPVTSADPADQGGGTIRFLAFHPDGRSFVAVSSDGRVHHWRLEGALIRTFGTAATADTRMPRADLSPDGTLLLVAPMEGKPALWSLQGERLQELTDPQAGGLPPSPPEAVRFSRDGSTLQVQTLDEIQIWSRQGTLLQRISRSSHGASLAGLSADGRWLVGGSPGPEVMVQLWKLP
ncbi:WD40 repeat domain-containing protein [Cyanobium sp. CH-040]|uniref:WD40 repeat domain-containing protein n=1 Tax=Cyanobium sp. CH-040 TaxID=2823708 RepID=UPI0020CEDF80|nr:WD40 repeat domain-containing protein [Cyanobium sp. CH-040]MCP9928238.1 WD40 repeat domain-containing protein [Cyanobium sp. CH-040]